MPVTPDSGVVVLDNVLTVTWGLAWVALRDPLSETEKQTFKTCQWHRETGHFVPGCSLCVLQDMLLLLTKSAGSGAHWLCEIRGDSDLMSPSLHLFYGIEVECPSPGAASQHVRTGHWSCAVLKCPTVITTDVQPDEGEFPNAEASGTEVQQPINSLWWGE